METTKKSCTQIDARIKNLLMEKFALESQKAAVEKQLRATKRKMDIMEKEVRETNPHSLSLSLPRFLMHIPILLHLVFSSLLFLCSSNVTLPNKQVC